MKNLWANDQRIRVSLASFLALALVGVRSAQAAPLCSAIFGDAELAQALRPAADPENQSAILLGETPAVVNDARRKIMKDLRADPTKLSDRAEALSHTILEAAEPGPVILGLDVLYLLHPETFARTMAQVIKTSLARPDAAWNKDEVRYQIGTRAVVLLKSDAAPANLRARWFIVLAKSPIITEHLSKDPNAARTLMTALTAVEADGVEHVPTAQWEALGQLADAWISMRLRAIKGEVSLNQVLPETDWVDCRRLALRVAEATRHVDPVLSARFTATASELDRVGAAHGFSAEP